MSIFPRPARPKALLADIKRVWNSSTGRYKLVFGVAALAVNSLILTGFILESHWGVLPEGPQIIYASDWPNTRTDDEIKTQQRIDAAEKRKLDDERRRQWKKVDDQLSKLGI